jgi:transcriptional regulator with XRE-family HTH domain
MVGNPTISGQAFADVLGIKHSTWSRYERGETEPSLDVLARLFQVTGISLTWLIVGRGEDNQQPGITVGDRLRWLREAHEPYADSAAALMGVSPEKWQAFEENADNLPLNIAQQVAQRYAATLDYLYRGRMDGIAPAVRVALLNAHPELDEKAPFQGLPAAPREPLFLHGAASARSPKAQGPTGARGTSRATDDDSRAEVACAAPLDDGKGA